MLRGILTTLLLMGAAAQAAPRVVGTPEKVVLGRDGEVRIRVEVDETAGELRWTASDGELRPAGEVDGARAFVWTPPDIRRPSRALIAFWQEAGEQVPEPGLLEIPLLGRTDLEMDTEPGAEVRVRVGGSTFGPERASKLGRVKVPIEVPPGIREAQVVATVAGQQTTRTVPLEVPSSAPVAVAFASPGVPPQGGFLLVAHSANAPAISVRSESAKVTRVVRRRNLAVFRVTPREGSSEVSATVRVGPRDLEPVQAAVGRSSSSPTSSAFPDGRLALQAALGFFAAGGANLGPSFELGGSWRLPVWDERLFAELGVGVRTASSSSSLSGLGSIDSRVVAVPIFAALRARLLSSGPFALDARGGLGAVPFRHSIDAEFQPSFGEGGLGFDAFLGAQGAYRFEAVPLELVLDVRGEWTRLRTEHLVATPGGLVLGLGARWVVP